MTSRESAGRWASFRRSLSEKSLEGSSQCKTYKDETRYNHSQYAVHVRYTFYTFIFVHLSFLPETGYS